MPAVDVAVPFTDTWSPTTRSPKFALKIPGDSVLRPLGDVNGHVLLVVQHREAVRPDRRDEPGDVFDRLDQDHDDESCQRSRGRRAGGEDAHRVTDGEFGSGRGLGY